jgi:hypothetical protein
MAGRLLRRAGDETVGSDDTSRIAVAVGVIAAPAADNPVRPEP